MRFWKPRAASTTNLSALPVLHEESICSQMREEVARYALGHMGGAGSVKWCLPKSTNAGGLGHVLPWLVSTYGRTAAGAPQKGTRSRHIGWSRPRNRRTGQSLDNHCQDGIGEVHSCLFRYSKTLLIRLRHCRLHHSKFPGKLGWKRLQPGCPLVLAARWPMINYFVPNQYICTRFVL